MIGSRGVVLNGGGRPPAGGWLLTRRTDSGKVVEAMVVFPCHVCRTQLSADDAQSGQLVRCPTCLTTLRVPPTQAQAQAAAAPAPMASGAFAGSQSGAIGGAVGGASGAGSGGGTAVMAPPPPRSMFG